MAGLAACLPSKSPRPNKTVRHNACRPPSPPTSALRHAARGTPPHLPSRHAPGAPVAGLSTRRQRAESARPPLPTPPERQPISESPTWGTTPCVRLPKRARHTRHLRRFQSPTPAPSGRQQRENTVPWRDAFPCNSVAVECDNHPAFPHPPRAPSPPPKQKAHPCE